MSIIPGVYIEEINSSAPGVEQMDLSIPVFIGYTQKAGRRGKSLLRVPVKISSLKEYISWFGHRFKPCFTISNKTTANAPSFLLNNQPVTLQYAAQNQLYLYQAVALFFLNGGNSCYVLSTGLYGQQTGQAINTDDFLGNKKLTPIWKKLDAAPEPKLIVLPDVVADKAATARIYKPVLEYCASTGNRFAILDLCQSAPPSAASDVQAFRDAIGNDSLQYGAAYYPWLQTDLVEMNEVNFTNLHPDVSLETLLQPVDRLVKKQLLKIAPGISTTRQKNIHLALMASSVPYQQLMNAIHQQMNLVPASGAIAGIYAANDRSRGIWKAPSNIRIEGALAPSMLLSNQQQEALLSDNATGKYINAIRQFSKGNTLLWGARTLAGNHNEWRYIPVRRTCMMLQQSIAKAMETLVFEPNTIATWKQLKTMVENFLINLWRQGALIGTKPEQAFHVAIGPGSSMTATDLAEGRLKMQVMVALLKPAEFLVISFEQIQHP